MNSIKGHLQQITKLNEGSTRAVNTILDGCEQQAKKGLDWYMTTVVNDNLEETVEYLVSVAKLNVEVTFRGDLTARLEINWAEEKADCQHTYEI